MPYATPQPVKAPFLEDQTLREAFQVHPVVVPFEQRLMLLEYLVASGLRRFQVGSMVRPDLMPQMALCERFAQEVRRFPEIEAWIMVFNRRGLDRAVGAGFKHIALSASLSDIHSTRNLNCTVPQALTRCLELAELALSADIEVRMGLQCAFGGPMLRAPSTQRIRDAFMPFVDVGVDMLALADTAGRATPKGVRSILKCLRQCFRGVKLGMHLHGKPTQLWANLQSAWNCGGFDWMDVSLDGKGGCPFLPGQPKANLSSAIALDFLRENGVDTGVEPMMLAKASSLLEGMLSSERLLNKAYQNV